VRANGWYDCRRTKERSAEHSFSLALEVRYAVSGRRAPVQTGSGRTIDLSSSGLSFTAGRPLVSGQKLDVSIDWPVLLDGVYNCN
jgi:hypothetical protein